MIEDSSTSPARVPEYTVAARELSVDLYRVAAVVVVVIGHWLVSAVTYRDGVFSNEYLLAVMPWTQWLTLVFQVVPVFFLVGGYASAASWSRNHAGKGDGPQWVQHRVGAILGPTALMLVVAAVDVAARKTHRHEIGWATTYCAGGPCIPWVSVGVMARYAGVVHC